MSSNRENFNEIFYTKTSAKYCGSGKAVKESTALK